MSFISSIAHINLTVPEGSLHLADAFYRDTLGLEKTEVPKAQQGTLAWYNISSSGQQIHVSHPTSPSELLQPTSRQHPCFRLASPEALRELQKRIWEHYKRGGDSAPKDADEPGAENSGAKGEEYPTRFFARDYSNNRLEFSL
ncbi:hypothetical protein CI109_103932 [Kwoniella shandongensis]|uniref:Uncharacterized protein n=1 Tax=Kwoniella shandongensis TaxID=1734106 RepID=A0A5M6BT19_9TREE|nr:uncharacterized protein CI109_005614 [Kwoniella shandongensis]KAA5526018.1 hypothetical protein CI109_005614 [Kwoniella shandongensis]